MMTRTREDIKARIAELETELYELRLILPPAVKSFFRFRTNRCKFVLVYAASEEQAKEKLNQRMLKDYGGDFQLHPVVDVFTDADTASNKLLGGRLILKPHSRRWKRVSC